MIEILQYALSGFWKFLGFLIILCLLLQTVVTIINTIFRHININKHGCPPPHCDADGDFKED